MVHTNDAAMLTAAVQYADAGYPVFFLGRTKRPVRNCPACPVGRDNPRHDSESCNCLTCHGFYAATTDTGRVRAMHRAVPGGMVAIRTGAVSGLAVIDIDPRNGGRVVPDLMPVTRCVVTGSGGWHLYYRHPGLTLAAKLRGHPGVDIKADGGYVVAPPSLHPVTRAPYRWIGDRPLSDMRTGLLAACRPTIAAPALPRDVPTFARPGISNPDALLRAHLDTVLRAPEGRRRHTLYGASHGVARLVAAGAITRADAWAALTDAGRQAGQTDREIRAAILGGFADEGVAA